MFLVQDLLRILSLAQDDWTKHDTSIRAESSKSKFGGQILKPVLDFCNGEIVATTLEACISDCKSDTLGLAFIESSLEACIDNSTQLVGEASPGYLVN